MTYMKKMLLPLNLQLFAGDDDKGFSAESIKKLQTDFTASWTELKGLLKTQDEELKKFGETSTETGKSLKTVQDTINKLEKDLKGVNDNFKELEIKMNRPGFGGKDEKTILTPGERFIESENYKNMVTSGSQICAPFQVGSFHKLYQKDLTSADAAGGILVSPYVMPGVNTPNERPMTMRRLLNVQNTTSNAIEYIRETGFTNAAAPVAEKALKPESTLTFDSQTATVKTIASWIPATRQIIADAAQLQNYVNSRLIYGLKLVEENQILFGTGTGENLQGIMTAPGVQDAGGLPAGVTILDHIRAAITMATIAGYPVTGVILHPTDFETIELQKGTDGHYIWVTVPNGGETRIWRVPVVESISMTPGSFLLGAFGLGAQLWEREDANVRVSDHHADFFIRNQIAILAEERLALTLYRPEAFVRGVFTAAV